MLTHFEVEGLNNSVDVAFDFHPDVNILTGRNGSGKTTVLKLIWFLISANIERIPREMTFKRLRLEADDFWIEIARQPRESGKNISKYRFAWCRKEGEVHESIIPLSAIREERMAVHAANRSLSKGTASVFFPTFRRLEGGFSLTSPRTVRQLGGADGIWAEAEASNHSRIKGYLDELSDGISNDAHTFVTGVSTQDVEALLTNRYAQMSKQTNTLQEALNKSIVSIIGTYKEKWPESVDADLAEAKKTLDQVAFAVTNVSDHTSKLLKPFNTLSALVGEVLQRGIRISGNIVLGSTDRVVDAASLSAGEKQMLSFLCYNSSITGGMFFIDEPELSLHVDWQRNLLPILLSQGAGSQIIAATHSPFIYSKYPENEIMISGKGE